MNLLNHAKPLSKVLLHSYLLFNTVTRRIDIAGVAGENNPQT